MNKIFLLAFIAFFKLAAGPGTSGGNPTNFLRSLETNLTALFPEPRVGSIVEYAIEYRAFIEYKFPGYEPLLNEKGTIYITQEVKKASDSTFWLYENHKDCADQSNFFSSECKYTIHKKHIRTYDRYILEEIVCDEDDCESEEPVNFVSPIGAMLASSSEVITVPAGTFISEYRKYFSQEDSFFIHPTCRGNATREIWYVDFLELYPFAKLNFYNELPENCWSYKKGSFISFSGYLINSQ